MIYLLFAQAVQFSLPTGGGAEPRIYLPLPVVSHSGATDADHCSIPPSPFALRVSRSMAVASYEGDAQCTLREGAVTRRIFSRS
jgi:hypothetical protein